MNFRSTPQQALAADFRSTPQQAGGAAIVAPAAPVVASDFEAATVQIGITSNQEIPVYSTKKRWRAVDVYVTLPGTFFQGPFISDLNPVVAIYVFAVVGSTRTLVGSGRLTREDQGIAKHVVSVHHALAEHFDVVFSAVSIGAGTIVGTRVVDVSILASDQAATPRPNVGVVPMLKVSAGQVAPIGSVQILKEIPSLVAPTQGAVQIVGVYASNIVGAARFLHLFDQGAAVVNTQTPLFEFAVPPGAPGGYYESPGLSSFLFRNGVVAAISTTPRVLTLGAANDIDYQLYFR